MKKNFILLCCFTLWPKTHADIWMDKVKERINSLIPKSDVTIEEFALSRPFPGLRVHHVTVTDSSTEKTFKHYGFIFNLASGPKRATFLIHLLWINAERPRYSFYDSHSNSWKICCHTDFLLFLKFYSLRETLNTFFESAFCEPGFFKPFATDVAKPPAAHPSV